MFTLLRLMAVCAWVAGQDQTFQDHKAKVAPVEVVEMKARRNDGLIELTAQVKNAGEKPIKGLRVIFKFENSAGDPVSTEEMKIDEPQLPAGAESDLNVQLRDSPRATQIVIAAESGGGAELTVGDSGPYPIE